MFSFMKKPNKGCNCSEKHYDLTHAEVSGFLWLEDAADHVAAWARFCIAFPELCVEELDSFLARVGRSKWHKHHKKHRHEPYSYSDVD
jgi:hypothetical protein